MQKVLMIYYISNSKTVNQFLFDDVHEKGMNLLESNVEKGSLKT